MLRAQECDGVPEGSSNSSSSSSNRSSTSTGVGGGGGGESSGGPGEGAGLSRFVGRRVPPLPRLASLPIFRRIPVSSTNGPSSQNSRVTTTTASQHTQLTSSTSSVMGTTEKYHHSPPPSHFTLPHAQFFPSLLPWFFLALTSQGKAVGVVLRMPFIHASGISCTWIFYL